ncbi:MAG: DUF4387 family protein [Gemmobacter sp.]
MRLGDRVLKVRSKNAGPFWVTIDVFCGDAARFAEVAARLDTARVAALYGLAPDALRRFDIADLSVVKFSLPRPVVQGAPEDRDMHGAAWACLLEEAALD